MNIQEAAEQVRKQLEFIIRVQRANVEDAKARHCDEMADRCAAEANQIEEALRVLLAAVEGQPCRIEVKGDMLHCDEHNCTFSAEQQDKGRCPIYISPLEMRENEAGHLRLTYELWRRTDEGGDMPCQKVHKRIQAFIRDDRQARHIGSGKS